MKISGNSTSAVSIPSWGKTEEYESIRGEIAITGVGETSFSGPSDRDAKAMALEAIEKAIRDAGLTPQDVDGLMVAKGIQDQIAVADYQDYFRTTHPMWFSTEGGAMVWGATCTHDAAMAIRSRKARHVVNVFSVDWATRRANGTGSPGDWHASEEMKAHFELPYGWYPQPLYFATFARRYMHEFGLTEAQLGEVAVAFRAHANRNPSAVMHSKPLDLDGYLAKSYLADPLRVEDCCLISDGAGAFVMSSLERAVDMPRPVVSVEGVGRGIINNAPYISQQGSVVHTPQALSAPWAFAMAECLPADLDVIAVYDCFSITALMQIEDLGLCEKGQGGRFVEGGKLRYDSPKAQGGIPCNTHGGLMSHAYVLGIAHIIELVKQLRGDAVNQVQNARLAAYAGFTADEASTLILKRVSS